MALRAVNIFKIGFIGYGLNPLLQGDHFVVAGHDAYRTKLQALCKVHSAHGQQAGCNLHVFIEHSVLESRPVSRCFRPVKLGCRADEHQISCGCTPSSERRVNQRRTPPISASLDGYAFMSGFGPLKSETAPLRPSTFPSTSAICGSSKRSACNRI